MRHIYLLRHAKTELIGAEQSDFDRALTDRGVRDAAVMGAHIQALPHVPELILCSTATRTRQTLKHMGLNLPTQLIDKLYLASAGEILGCIQDVDDAVKSVLVIGHNPGMHELAALLMRDAAKEEDIDQLSIKYPTCTMAGLQLDVPHWADIAPDSALLSDLFIARD